MYVKVENNTVAQYPYSLVRMKRDNSNTAFPQIISDELAERFGVFPVTVADEPSYDERTQVCKRASQPVLSDGVWTLSYNVSNKTDEQIAQYDSEIADYQRGKRNRLLWETDYFALSDVIMSDNMQLYRQQLRDITTHENWPHLSDNDWPTKP